MQIFFSFISKQLSTTLELIKVAICIVKLRHYAFKLYQFFVDQGSGLKNMSLFYRH